MTATSSSVPRLEDASTVTELVDWGPVAAPIEGLSKTAGRMIHRGSHNESECGIWTCTPGSWDCHVTSDEFCYFISGTATYTHESGEVIEVGPDVVAFFAEGWRGTCVVHTTVRKAYMIR